MFTDDSHDQLEAQLDSALQARLGADAVDVAALVQGSRRQAHRIRMRRVSAAVAVAVLVVAVPVGYELNPLHPHSQSAAADSAALLPSSAPDLPSGLKLQSSTAVSAGWPRVRSSTCIPDDPPGPKPASGRQWTWSDRAGRLTVDLTVTRWTAATSTAGFAEVITHSRYCEWNIALPERRFAAPQADASWASTATGTTVVHYARSAIRVGDGIAVIEVQAPDSAQAISVADRLARYEAGGLRQAS